MWKVRILGLDEKSFGFVMKFDPECFSSNNFPHGEATITEHYFQMGDQYGADATIVLVHAEEQLKIYRSILNLSGYKSELKVDHPIRIEEDGKETIFLSFIDELCISDFVDALVVDGESFGTEDRSVEFAKKIIASVRSDPTRRDLLVLLTSEVSWINAYKIYEIIKSNYIPESDLKKLPELKYFSHTANSPEAIGIEEARHAVQSHQSPRKIADLKSAHSRLVQLAVEFINGGSS
jgi:hypothetical protein